MVGQKISLRLMSVRNTGIFTDSDNIMGIRRRTFIIANQVLLFVANHIRRYLSVATDSVAK